MIGVSRCHFACVLLAGIEYYYFCYYYSSFLFIISMQYISIVFAAGYQAAELGYFPLLFWSFSIPHVCMKQVLPHSSKQCYSSYFFVCSARPVNVAYDRNSFTTVGRKSRVRKRGCSSALAKGCNDPINCKARQRYYGNPAFVT